jgi:hypothetical protein
VNKFKDTDQRGELRDLFAALAMHKLIDGNATPVWVANRAYEYADIMLVQRDTVSHNNNNKETLINE